MKAVEHKWCEIGKRNTGRRGEAGQGGDGEKQGMFVKTKIKHVKKKRHKEICYFVLSQKGEIECK